MTPGKMLTIISIIAGLLTCAYYGVKTYKELKPTITTTTAPMAPPVSHKETNTLTWTREVVVGGKK
jgi:hypothetical protein